AREDMLEEGAMEASLLDIFSYAKPLLSSSDPETLASGSVTNAILFMALAFVSGITTFSSGSLFGITGEKMAMRLRMDVFKAKSCNDNLLRQLTKRDICS
ncbi:hypothetical protein NECAME_18876, partial [Necator americanus]